MNREDRKGYSYNMLNSEAGRCMNCGCLAVNPSDMATALLASDAVIRTNLRTLGAQELLTSHTRISDTLLKGELILEIQIPWDAAGTISGYEKFRLRKSIDFAVVALAYRYVLDDGEMCIRDRNCLRYSPLMKRWRRTRPSSMMCFRAI